MRGYRVSHTHNASSSLPPNCGPLQGSPSSPVSAVLYCPICVVRRQEESRPVYSALSPVKAFSSTIPSSAEERGLQLVHVYLPVELFPSGLACALLGQLQSVAPHSKPHPSYATGTLKPLRLVSSCSMGSHMQLSLVGDPAAPLLLSEPEEGGGDVSGKVGTPIWYREAEVAPETT